MCGVALSRGGIETGGTGPSNGQATAAPDAGTEELRSRRAVVMGGIELAEKIKRRARSKPASSAGAWRRDRRLGKPPWLRGRIPSEKLRQSAGTDKSLQDPADIATYRNWDPRRSMPAGPSKSCLSRVAGPTTVSVNHSIPYYQAASYNFLPRDKNSSPPGAPGRYEFQRKTKTSS